MTDHPITPPPELVQQWASESLATQNLCTRAAQWGADQELEACIDVLSGQWQWDTLFECTEWKEFRDKSKNILRAARRPKPQTLASIALQTLDTIERDAHYLPEITDTIRRAILRLKQLEDSNG